VKQSFGDKEETPKVLETHKKDVEFIKSRLGSDLLSFVQECLPLGHDDNYKAHAL
jgi:hypothetical protein